LKDSFSIFLKIYAGVDELIPLI